MSDDEFDNIPDDFADIEGVDWAQILAGPSGSTTSTETEEHIPSIPPRPRSANSSTDYFEDDYDDLDPSLLAELDRIEEEITAAPQHPHFMGGGADTQKKRKDVAADSQSGEEIPNKGKAKANVMQRIISAYEDEITCPICCDLYVFAHISNPCGHSFCDSCGREWHLKNDSCPVCRTYLNRTSPMIPNITIDNVVEKHIQALALSGDRDWEPGGFKAKEWYKRKLTRRNSARERENIIKSPAILEARTFIRDVIDLTGVFDQPPNWFLVEDNLETDPTYEEPGDNELIPRPIRRRRQRRRAAGPTVVNLE
ncbi:hypothetical protein BYT27DRAFT_7164559 [Phlegmacium glaucopus]|nr:hypothetical protein BYT27DRAFT_7164559 [Phlegmacium glaucopus]